MSLLIPIARITERIEEREETLHALRLHGLRIISWEDRAKHDRLIAAQKVIIAHLRALRADMQRIHDGAQKPAAPVGVSTIKCGPDGTIYDGHQYD